MSEIPENARFATRAVHAGLRPDPHYGSIVPAIHQTSTYVQPAPGEFVGEYEYSRAANPTRRALEDALGELEGGYGTAFGSGMAAEHALITAVCGAGDHIVLSNDLYGGYLPPRRQDPQPLGPRVHDGRPARPGRGRARRAAEHEDHLGRDADEPDAQRDRRGGGHRAQAGRAGGGRQHVRHPGAPAPAGARADAVVHSTTKYLGGHSDTIGGALIVADAELHQQVRLVQKAVGAIPGPLDCFLVHRGLRTLHLRVAAHGANGMAVSTWLRDAPRRLRRALARLRRHGLVPPSRRGADLHGDEGVLARRVAGRRSSR
jgi:cystathionine gamma-synthase